MEKIVNFFKDKSYGFYVTVISIIFTIITFSVYVSSYSKFDAYMSWEGFYFMVLGAVLALITIILKRYSWAPIILAATNFIGLLYFILKIYNYVTVVLVGIDLTSVSATFITCTVLFAINVVLSTANVFFKQSHPVELGAKENN